MTEIIKIRFKTTSSDCTPVKAYATDAGWDVFAAESKTLKPMETFAVSLGIKCAIPSGYCIVLKERSGLALKSNVRIGGGVIDSSYRGELKAIVQNLGSADFIISVGMKLTQMLVLPVPSVEFINVGGDELDITDRATGGFGSTGLQK